MYNDELDALINDPDLTTAAACHALLELARRRSPHDPDIAGDVVLLLSERLMPGGILRRALATHPNPAALLNASASNAANQARESAGRQKRVLPLTSTGIDDELEPPQYPYSPTIGLFDVLHDLGWREDTLMQLAIPRKRPGRSIHPGIEAGLEHLAACYGVTVRCAGCPTDMDLLRLNLQGPDAWPALVPVLQEWGWSDEAIAFITTSPANIAHWRTLAVTPPPRQERRMIKIAHTMRFTPWLLQDSDVIRESIRTARVRAPEPATPAGAVIDCTATDRPVPLQARTATGPAVE
jgi:hypothetical protein